MKSGLACLVLLGACFAAQTSVAQQPRLHVAGDVYSGGAGTVSIEAPSSIGQPALLLLGLNPLPLQAPIVTGKGGFYVGLPLQTLVVGAIPAGGWLNIPFLMPSLDPALAGTHLALQGFVAGKLSTPATLPQDQPYYEWSAAQTITAPVLLKAAAFGDRIAVGDLNADGVKDLIVGAWKESYAGIFFSGRVYVLWGPGFTSSVALSPPVPKYGGVFGAGFVVADLDNDGIDDLVVGDGVGDPPLPQITGNLRVYLGGPSFSDRSAFSIAGSGSNLEYTQYGRSLAAGDLNGDGWMDLAVGLPHAADGNFVDAGRIDVYWGPEFAVPTSLWSPDAGDGAFFGTDILIRDLDADGIADLVEASSRDDYGGVVNAGTVHVFGGAGLSPLAMILSPEAASFNARFGSAIDAADLNGDGLAEIIITDEKGHAFIAWGPDYGSETEIFRPIAGTGGAFSYFVATGDANGDGIVDIALSDVFAGGKGEIYVALGPQYATFLKRVDPRGTSGDEFGWSLLFSDLDGDGRDDLLVGSDFADYGSVLGPGKVTLLRP